MTTLINKIRQEFFFALTVLLLLRDTTICFLQNDRRQT